MMQHRSQEQMLLWIDMTGFMAKELNLYLDTHPHDEKAMELFNQYNAMHQKAMKEYAAEYTPLTVATASPDKKWCWGQSKNPWERGCV